MDLVHVDLVHVDVAHAGGRWLLCMGLFSIFCERAAANPKAHGFPMT
jgi:hypothetical protein